jgi:hypothetical protein
MNATTVRSSILIAVFAGALFAPRASQAQASGVVAPVTTVPRVSITPSRASSTTLAPVGVTNKLRLAPVNLTSNMSGGEHIGSNKAMMGAGVVAIIVGLIIGGDVGTLIAVGGAIFGLVGLYRYMR